MTHQAVKANLEKGFSWPSEAIPYGLYLRVDFWYPKGQNPHLGPDPRCPQVLKPPVPIQLLNKDLDVWKISEIMVFQTFAVLLNLSLMPFSLMHGKK